MREIIGDVDSWLQEDGTEIALATVINTWGSAPRKTGAKMAVTDDGRITGSVSGGCVEGAVVEAALETLQTRKGQLLHFGVADEEAWEVGLACGGNIDVFVEVLDKPSYQFSRQRILNNKSGYVFTYIDDSEFKGQKVYYDGEGFESIMQKNPSLASIPAQTFKFKKSQRVSLENATTIFIDYLEVAPTLILVGGVHVAITLAAMAKMLDFSVIVVDPRRAFGSQERFSNVDDLIQEWPQKAFENIELTADMAVALLTHDPKIDDPALKILLNSPIFYIGALGSQKTHTRRKERLKKMGFDQDIISRIHAPIGLDIGADSPEEIALAILAEIVASRHGSL